MGEPRRPHLPVTIGVKKEGGREVGVIDTGDEEIHVSLATIRVLDFLATQKECARGLERGEFLHAVMRRAKQCAVMKGFLLNERAVIEALERCFPKQVAKWREDHPEEQLPPLKMHFYEKQGPLTAPRRRSLLARRCGGRRSKRVG